MPDVPYPIKTPMVNNPITVNIGIYGCNPRLEPPITHPRAVFTNDWYTKPAQVPAAIHIAVNNILMGVIINQ